MPGVRLKKAINLQPSQDSPQHLVEVEEEDVEEQGKEERKYADSYWILRFQGQT